MASDLLRERLPPGWHLGVTDDGRIFFIDDQRRVTSWLHPVTGLPVESGLLSHPDLPPGWEQDTTPDGLVYYVDHSRGITTFEHPLYGYNEISNYQQQQQLQLQQQQQQLQSHPSSPAGHSDRGHPTTQSPPATPGSPTSPGGKENFKRGTPKQRSVKAPSAKRNPQAVVVKRGWLHRLESAGIPKSKAWKKRWCVLADFALFIYKGEDELTTLDSILLPSYRINPSTEADNNIKRNFVFKVEHENTKTLYLAAEDSPDSVSWMSLLRQAAMMDGNVGFQREQNNNFRQHPHKGGDRHEGARGDNRNVAGLIDQHSPQSPGFMNPASRSSPNRYGTGPYHPQSPSYQGYGDPASSPPYDQRPQHNHQQYSPQQQHNNPQHRQSYTSADDGGFNPYSPDRSFNRNSQAGGYPPSLRGDESFRDQHPQHFPQSHHTPGRDTDAGGTDPKNFSNPIYHQYPSPSSSSSSARPQLLQQQQQRHSYSQQPRQLRDGFAPDSDSARNSIAQSDASGGRRSYQPAQAERQRLQQELGGGTVGMDPRRPTSQPHFHQQPLYASGKQVMDISQRDSYSGESSMDGGTGGGHQRQYSHPDSHQVVVKQLRPWDTSFPDLEVVTAKQHGSFDDLLDPGNRVGRHSARGVGNKNSGGAAKPTFNARSKSHENFSRLPPEEMPSRLQQQQQQHYSPSHQQQYSPYQQGHDPYDNHDGPNVSHAGHQSIQDSSRSPYSRGHNSNDHRDMQDYARHHLQQQPSARSSFSSPHQRSHNERMTQGDNYPPHHSGSPAYNARDSYASSTNMGPYNHNTSSQNFTGPPPPPQGYNSNNMNSSFRGSVRGTGDPSLQARPLSFSSAQGGSSPSSSSRQPSHHHPDHSPDLRSVGSNPHTYVNFPHREQANTSHSSSYRGSPQEPPPTGAPPPGRPPYPVAVRRQMVEEMAQVQTPVTQNDFLTAAELNQQRMQQPSFFQYPSPRDQYGNKIPMEAAPHNISHASMHSGVSGHQNMAARNLPNSRLSSASRASSSSRRGDNRGGPDSSDGRTGSRGGPSSPHETSFSRTNMMDPEAQKLRMAYERVHSLRMAPDKAATSVPSSAQTLRKSDTSDKGQHSSHDDNNFNTNLYPGQNHGRGSHSETGFPRDEEDEPGEYQNLRRIKKSLANEQQQQQGQPRAYRSQEELDRVGRTPPPTGAYRKIPDEPVDLYRRGSAFSPPASQTSGSMQRLDTVPRHQHQQQQTVGKMVRSMSTDVLSRSPPNTRPEGNSSSSHWLKSRYDDDDGPADQGNPDHRASLRRQSKVILQKQQNFMKPDQPGQQQQGKFDDKTSRNNDGIVRARLISVYDNVDNASYTPRSASARSKPDVGGIAKEYHQEQNVNPSSGETGVGDLKKSRGYATTKVTREEHEHLFFEPYVNMRDSMVLFPRHSSTETDKQGGQGALSSQPFKLAAPPKRKPAPIQTVKEDPNMSDREVLETNLQKIAKKNPLAGPRLRMSISAGDLIGKTHDELVLLLIQLRRNQAALEKARDYYRTLIERCRPDELEYKRQMHQFGNVPDGRLLHRHQNYVEARAQTEEVENKLEVYKPIINLLDNMVTMGSLYGGDNLMLATQYRKHLLRPDQYQPPKKMLEFSRQHQERRLQQETEEEIRQLSSDEVDLEEKIDRLNELDRLLQEQSFKVSSFREDKELLEKALVGVLRQQEHSYHGDPRELTRLTNQQRTLEKEISRVTQQLAEASKELEETSAENSKLEHEVALLRTKVHGELSRSRSAPSLSSENVRTKMQMEKELAKVEGMMAGLSQQGQKLQEAMSTIRRSSSSSHLAAAALDKTDSKAGYSPTSPHHSTYLQTDLDTGEEVDLAQAHSPHTNNSSSSSGVLSPNGTSSRPVINHQRQNAGTLEDWDMEGVDENTKRFFGLMPRDKPKGQTLREVKRLSEQRKERDKGRRDGDDSMDGQEIKLRVSNVDNEVSSIIHARIPSDATNKLASNGSHSNGTPYESGLPLYENLPGSKNDMGGNTGSTGPNRYPVTARRSSLILMAPKPFTPYQERSSARPFKSELALNVAGNGTDAQDSSTASNSGRNVWQPSGSASVVNERPYRSVDFLNSSDSNTFTNNASGFNAGHSLHKREESLYSTDSNNNSNNNNDNPGYVANGNAYENDYIPQGQTQTNTYGSYHHQFNDDQLHPSEMSQLEAFSESADHITRPVDPATQASTSRAYAARPWATKGAQFADDNLFNSRRNSRGRYMTISSSEPIKMEIAPALHSSAGDLILNRSIDNVPDIVKSSQSKVDQIDEDTIDREILYVPDKVLIPERYDAEADAEQLTEEEREARKERAERIRKVLTTQSVLSMSQPDVSQLNGGGDIHSRVRQEKKEREHFLALGQELARQVTLKSKKQAAERRKTWSGAQFADAKAQYEAEMAGSPASSPLRSPGGERKRAEITLHDL